MSNTQDLKEYLVGENGFLLNDMHNGKTIMLSGAWGSGKTHFWQNEIEPTLLEKLKNDKTCTYISLYGKDSLSALKQEVFIKASTENSLLSKEVSTFGFEALLSMEDKIKELSDLSIGKTLNAVKGLSNYRKSTKGIKKLKDGGVVCFDDFERKSKSIDLNDLFGFISQLAISLKCKAVIILNSDVFEGEEAKVFKTVKEKTVNKFFYFEPSKEELYYLIASEAKYGSLENYKTEILHAILETEELNARIYIQVLDNALEWLDENSYDQNQLRTLVLITVNFIKNHFVFDYKILEANSNAKLYNILIPYHKDEGLFEISNYFIKNVLQSNDGCGCEEFLHQMRFSISKKDAEKDGRVKGDSYYEKLDKTFDENKEIFYALYYYAYTLKVERGVNKSNFDKINSFVKTGILPKSEKVEDDS